MKKKCSGLVLIAALLLVAVSCKKQTDTTFKATDPASYFMPLQTGKYITYRLDSLTFYYYGLNDTVTSYLAKDSVEGPIEDALGRPAWRVVRYLNDTTGNGPWTPAETYMVIPTSSTVEVVENNLHFIKLAYPVTEGSTWNGNSYLSKNPYQDLFLFSATDNINAQLWNFAYQQVNKPFSVNNKMYDSTLSVLEVADSSNVPIVDPSTFASKTYWSDVYAKNIGLIYRRTQLWEYQAPSADGLQSSYKLGFELTLAIIDHN
ncbi:MAG TPA: hypothetical protein VK563_10175 [Puia sp.]|nr:hypothetical protein [Puia sp.]